MNPILRNILAVIAGAVIGGAINMIIISISGSIIPPPEGADLTSTEGMKASAHLLEPRHFIMPFLAHALGTLSGAIITGFVAATRKMLFALMIGTIFLAGGIVASVIIPAPTWFVVTDLIVAYMPMAWIGGKITARK